MQTPTHRDTRKKDLAFWILAPVLAICVLLPIPSIADIVTFTNGERREGIVTPAPGNPDAIRFQQVSSTVTIPRDRIRSITEEDDATDLRKLGELYFAAKQYGKAIDSFQKALLFAPDNPRLNEKIKMTQAALAREASVDRRKQLVDIDAALTRAEEHIDEKKFKVAEEILISTVPARDPSDAQIERIHALKKHLYKSWGLDLEDKIKEMFAAPYYEKYLALEPGDKDIYKRLIAIWGKMPEKTEQVIKAHEIQVQLHPDDLQTRKRLADKYVEQAKRIEVTAAKEETPEDLLNVWLQAHPFYEKAAAMYEALNKVGDFEESDIEKGLIETLRSLWKRALRMRDYDQAIAYHKRLQLYDETADSGEIDRMAFRRDAQGIDPKNVPERVKLALRLRSQGQHEMARAELERLRSQFPADEQVVAALHLYAEGLRDQMLDAWRKLRYERANALATRCISEYGYLADIKEEATRIRNLVAVELAKEKRLDIEESLKYRELGDQYYREAQYHVRAMSNLDIDRSIMVVNNKNEAIRLFGLAINAYDKALRYRNELERTDREGILTNRASAQSQYKKLTSKRPLRGPNTPKRTGTN